MSLKFPPIQPFRRYFDVIKLGLEIRDFGREENGSVIMRLVSW